MFCLLFLLALKELQPQVILFSIDYWLLGGGADENRFIFSLGQKISLPCPNLNTFSFFLFQKQRIGGYVSDRKGKFQQPWGRIKVSSRLEFWGSKNRKLEVGKSLDNINA